MNIPVPAPSSNAITPWNSDEHDALCNIKSVKTSSALQTWRERERDRMRICLDKQPNLQLIAWYALTYKLFL